MVAYTNDIVVITETRNKIKERLDDITKEGSKIGFSINEGKTKIIRFGKEKQHTVVIERYEFEEVDKFRYLGTMTNK